MHKVFTIGSETDASNQCTAVRRSKKKNSGAKHDSWGGGGGLRFYKQNCYCRYEHYDS